jgi:RimJ/RimL family protein N-acetyltransferase
MVDLSSKDRNNRNLPESLWAVRGRHLDARVPDGGDLMQVWHWLNLPEVAYTWRWHGTQVSLPQFQESVARDTAAHFVGIRRSNGEVAAYAALFAVDLRAAHAQVGLMSSPRYLRSGLSLELAAMMIEHAFAVYPLRKVYFEMPDVNLVGLRTVVGRFARLEATLPDFVYVAGRLCANLVFSMDRATWNEVARDTVEMLLGPSDGNVPL